MKNVFNIQKIILLIFLLPFQLLSQDLALDWASSFGGTSDDIGFDMEKDNLGNLIVVGAFKGTVDFDPSSSIFNLTSTGDNDIYVVKFNPNGDFLWAKRMGGSGFDRAHTVEVTPNNDIIVGGIFYNTVDFDPGSGVSNLTSVGNADAYIQKLDEDGNHIWVKSLGGYSYDRINSIDIDHSGNVLIGGQFRGSVDFDPGVGIYTLTTGSTYNSFVLKLTTLGDFVWARHFGTYSQNDVCYGLTIDQDNNVYSSGFFKGTVDFDPSSSTNNLSTTLSSRAEVYISKLDSNGQYIWAKNFPASSGIAQGNLGWKMKVSPSGNIITTGYFSGSVDFDPNAGSNVLSSNGDRDGFVSTLNSEGEFISAFKIGGTGEDRIHGVDFDINGNLYYIGFFSSGSSVDFDSSPTSDFTLTAQGNRDIFILKTDSNNTFAWAYQFGDNTNSPYLSDVGMNIMVDNNMDVYAIGTFDGNSDFDPSTNTYMLNSNGEGDAFIVKFNQILCSPTSAYISESICSDSYISPSGQVYMTTGLYNDTIINALGCDSVITLDLTFNTIANTLVTNGGNVLSINGNPIGTTYQWIDCNGNTILPGETNEDFYPSYNSTYAVIINNNGCIDTSACVTVSKIGLEEVSTSDVVSIYPNPITNNTLNIKTGVYANNGIHIIVRNNLGVVLREYHMNGYETQILLPDYNGLLFVDVIIDNKRITKKLIQISKP